MEFSRQEYWSRLPFPSLGDRPDPGIEPAYPALQADSLPLSHWEAQESYENLVLNLNSSFPGGSALKYLPVNVGDTGLIPGSGRPLEKEMAAHSSIIAWKTPWTEEPGGVQSMGSQKSQTQVSD